MIVSTSDNSDPARISFRISSTASLEKKPDSFRLYSSLFSTRDCIAEFIIQTPGLETAQAESATQSSLSPDSVPGFRGYKLHFRASAMNG